MSRVDTGPHVPCLWRLFGSTLSELFWLVGIRIGSTQTRTVDVRVLAATHRNLQERVRQELFRQDLYYRLAVFPNQIPPLRDRKDDIAGLCEVLSAQIAKDLKQGGLGTEVEKEED